MAVSDSKTYEAKRERGMWRARFKERWAEHVVFIRRVHADSKTKKSFTELADEFMAHGAMGSNTQLTGRKLKNLLFD